VVLHDISNEKEVEKCGTSFSDVPDKLFLLDPENGRVEQEAKRKKKNRKEKQG